ncbi:MULTISPECIES: hypothetical protein [Pantoea]|uniref:hypothetical protein n=1 Tax=Pantoea TaxID=53335 RepID=UPI00177EB271|nr:MULTISPECIES: hypothetical protein [Pantoea]MBD9660840.1 hypothetical protein [Pantoea sp. PNT03]
MQELVMKIFGLNGYVTGGKAMADRLQKSGVKDISVDGRGSVIVRNENGGKMSHYREAAKRFVEQDAQAVAAGSKDNDND